MGANQNGRVARSESDWRTILDRFDRSGQSQLTFCKEAGISPSSFHVWRRKLGVRRSRAEFIDVSAVPRAAGPWSIEIEFPDGTTARVRG